MVFTLLVRPGDLPEPEAVSPAEHLEARKARIYESLRDLQFEFRVGKLSEADYQKTKEELQRNLARVTEQIERVLGGKPPVTEAVRQAPAAPQPKKKETTGGTLCIHCGAEFDQPLRFCGECGQRMQGENA